MAASEGLWLVTSMVTCLANIAAPFGLFLWGRSLARRRGGRAWRAASYMPLLAIGVWALGVLATITMLVGSFREVAFADAAGRATMLARGISEAMNATAVGLVLSVVLYVASIVTFAVGELTKPPVSRP